MYWNTDRIYADIDNWMIFAKMQDGETIGCVYYMIDADGWFEIYGLDLKDDNFDGELFEELLRQALNSAKELAGKYMTFFCDAVGEKIVTNLGFECVGEYVCYKKHII